jgi:hypothetical protein
VLEGESIANLGSRPAPDDSPASAGTVPTIDSRAATVEAPARTDGRPRPDSERPPSGVPTTGHARTADITNDRAAASGRPMPAPPVPINGAPGHSNGHAGHAGPPAPAGPMHGQVPHHNGQPVQGDRGPGCTAPQLRRFIKSRPYVPMHELRRRFGIDGQDDDVTGVAMTIGRIYVGLPEREGALLGELLRGGEIGYELSLDPRTPIVIGVYPMRPVPRP